MPLSVVSEFEALKKNDELQTFTAQIFSYQVSGKTIRLSNDYLFDLINSETLIGEITFIFALDNHNKKNILILTERSVKKLCRQGQKDSYRSFAKVKGTKYYRPH